MRWNLSGLAFRPLFLHHSKSTFESFSSLTITEAALDSQANGELSSAKLTTLESSQKIRNHRDQY